MSITVCRACGKVLGVGAEPGKTLCETCGLLVAPGNVVTPAPARTQLSAKESGLDLLLSPWLIAALVSFLSAIGLIAVNADSMKKGFSWLTGVSLVLIFGSFILALIALADRGARRRRAARGPLTPAQIAARAELSHRWGRMIIVGTGGLCLIVVGILTVLSLAVGIPLGLYLMMVGATGGGLAFVGLLIYLCVVLPRVGYFALTQRAAKPDDIAHSEETMGTTDERIRPAPDRLQSETER
jgi:hypothetical protein